MVVVHHKLFEGVFIAGLAQGSPFPCSFSFIVPNLWLKSDICEALDNIRMLKWKATKTYSVKFTQYIISSVLFSKGQRKMKLYVGVIVIPSVILYTELIDRYIYVPDHCSLEKKK